MACKYFGSCKHQSGWCKSESALIRCVYGLNEQCTGQSWKIEALEAENKELKRLLELAVEDIKSVSFCHICINTDAGDRCEKCKVVTLDEFKWRYADEALKLIGGKNET